MTKYREILRLHSLNLSQQIVADSYNGSKKTASSVLKEVKEKNISWPLDILKSLPEVFSRRKKSIQKHA